MIILNMKKVFLYLAMASIALTSCRKDEEVLQPEVSIDTQNSYDDQAAAKYLETHYFDSKGNVKDFVETDTVNVKLSELNPVTLPSGVIYVMRPDAQPVDGTPIGNSDIIRLMSNTTTFVATNNDNKVLYTSAYPFRNTISGSGSPEVDPAYYFVKKEILNNAVNDYAKVRSFYEIEGFKEGLQKFEAFDIPDESNYNLQGLIIVPSRAAFSRDPHSSFGGGISLRNRSFVFNFQVYKTTAAPADR